jgi:hypothetical protein
MNMLEAIFHEQFLHPLCQLWCAWWCIFELVEGENYWKHKQKDPANQEKKREKFRPKNPN